MQAETRKRRRNVTFTKNTPGPPLTNTRPCDTPPPSCRRPAPPFYAAVLPPNARNTQTRNRWRTSSLALMPTRKLMHASSRHNKCGFAIFQVASCSCAVGTACVERSAVAGGHLQLCCPLNAVLLQVATCSCVACGGLRVERSAVAGGQLQLCSLQWPAC